MDVTKQFALQCQKGTSDKVYIVEIRPIGGDRYEVWAQNGRRGGTLQSRIKAHSCRLDEAEKAAAQIVKEKITEGDYTYMAGNAPSVQLPNQNGDSKIEAPVAGPMLLEEADLMECSSLRFDDDWMLQPKFDGHRCLLLSQNGQVTGLSRSQAGGWKNEKTLDSRIVQAAKAWSERHVTDFVIDGELIGETYVAFDVLQVGGQMVHELAASYRSGYIESMWEKGQGNGSIIPVVTAHTESEKEDLYRSCFENGMEGVVLKRKGSPYAVGQTKEGRKVKFVNTADVICTGQRGDKRSVGMKLCDGTVIGSVTIPVNKAIPAAGEILSVRYLYRGAADGHLVQAVYLGTRNDVPASVCTGDKLRVKGAKRVA